MGNRRKLKECEKDYEITRDEKEALEIEFSKANEYIVRLTSELAHHRDLLYKIQACVPTPLTSIIGLTDQCPRCHERDEDKLIWDEDGKFIVCKTCGYDYKPGW